ncbi:MAG: serine hydrolase domain-containing protein [Aeromicrobium sp.]
MTTAAGTFDPRFGDLADLLHANVADGTERGASLCVIQDGEMLVDIWDGWADPESTVPWQRDTLVPVWSITKVMTNLTALVLADRGLLDLDAPVATYWPEFAAAGKAGVTIAQLLGHTSGVSGWAQPVTVDDLYDWELSTSKLAAQPPWWTPGDGSGYHLLNQGHLVGEVVRRVTGLSVGAYFAKEIAGPLDADFHIGLPDADDERVSPLTSPGPIALDPFDDADGIALRTMTGPFVRAREVNTERWRRAEIPAANGHGNARSIARIQSIVSHGGELDDIRLLSPGTIERIFEVQASGVDRVLGLPLTFGTGWALADHHSVPWTAEGRRCFWGGLGGSVVVNDVDQRLTIAYAMNRMVLEHAPGTRIVRPCGDSRFDRYAGVISEALR